MTTERTEPTSPDQEEPQTPAEKASDKADMLTLEICFLGLAGVLVVAAFFEALTYQLVSSRTPFVIIVPLFVLILMQALRLYPHRHEAGFGGRMRTALTGGMPGLNKVVKITLWLVGLLLIIVGFGHFVGLGVFCFGLMWRLGGVPPKLALIVALGTLAAIFIIFEIAFDLELYRGLFFRYLAGYRDF